MNEALNTNGKHEKRAWSSDSHSSLEIEHHNHDAPNEHLPNHSKISGEIIPEHMSVSLMDASGNYAYKDPEKKESSVASDGYLQGAMLMGITTLFWSTYHIVIKYVYTMNPGVNCYDTVLFMGLFCTPVYYIYGKYLKYDLNFFNFENKVKIIIVIRIMIGLTNNIAQLVAFYYISIGKAVLIFSLNPLFCAIAAGIFLKEQISATSVILILCSVFGVYLLTLNKTENSHDEDMEFIGYLLILGSACLYGSLFVINRYLILYQVPIIVSPLYFGIGCLLQSFFLLIFIPDYLHFEEYDSATVIGLCVTSTAIVMGQMTWMYSTKYSAASKMAPIGYLENVFTLLSDVIIFNYNFIFSDFSGMAVIVVCLAIPIVMKYRDSKKQS